ncbi:MAG: hypothetical protein KA761_08475 [Gemmatimonadaceae bacterium]|jgi:hypothetical protein|nr:hypothetical protein [Gemmatimonadaceae bacterium]
MKALMIPIVAFLVCFALAGGAGAYATRPAAVADSTHADSTHADTTHAAAGEHAPTSTLVPNQVEPDSAMLANDPHAADPSHAPATTPTAPAPAPAPTTPPATAPVGPASIASLVRAQTGATVSMRPDGTIGPDRPSAGPDYQRMASLLSKMGAREAARTLEQLAPNEAARALAAMSDKQAALVLAQLAPEKAAALLQAALALVPRTTTP